MDMGRGAPWAALQRWARAGMALWVASGCGGIVHDPDARDEAAPAFQQWLYDGQRVLTDKLDLLFVIDNSMSMADKQDILRRALPVLVGRLVDPPCIGGDGNEARANPDTGECPGDSRREFKPIDDIHIGVITTSMGDAGANQHCTVEPSSPDSLQQVDNGYLLGSLARGGGAEPGFLTWTGTGADELTAAFAAQIAAAGEHGCGSEAVLESWYHFLVDPEPWSALDRVTCRGQAAPSANCVEPRIPVAPDGTRGDPRILAQRRAFLRPDSLVAVVMLSDENDCSIKTHGPFNLVARTALRMFRGSDACADDPNDPCCHSCGTPTPEGCPDLCTGDRNLPNELDEPNLRCFDQKRRFGLDFLFPTQRYVHALTETRLGLCNDDLSLEDCEPEEIVGNPLIANDRGELVRHPSLVFLVGIVGVPWQLLASSHDEQGAPYPASELHFATAAQLSEVNGDDDVTGWDRIVGEPHVRDLHMLEAVALEGNGRAGLPSSGAGYLADPVSGHEWTSPQGDMLQYACIFPLPEPRDCDAERFEGVPCDCRSAIYNARVMDNPLCQAEDGSYSSVQVAAKAYPGLRQLEVLRGVGERTENAVAASICARNVDDPSAQDFGYTPSVQSMLGRFKLNLVGE